MWFYSSPLGIAHHMDKTSRALLFGPRFFIIGLNGTVVRGSRSSQCDFAECALISGHWNPSYEAFVCKIWMAASLQWHFLSPCSWSIIRLSRSSEVPFKIMESWAIWLEMWFSRYIFMNWKSAISTRWCAISELIWIVSSSMWLCSQLQKESSVQGHTAVCHVCSMQAAFSRLLWSCLYIYWYWINWKHPG